MPSNFDSEKRKLLHQKSQQLTTGYGKPNNATGKEGDIAFRQIEGSGTVQYLKSNDEWVAVSSSGLMPPQRIMVGGGTSSTTGSSSGVTDHGYLSGRNDDDHSQYVHISTARTISANHAFTGTPTFTNGTFTSIDINGGTIDGTAISADSTQTEWDAAYTHSQVTGGDSVHVSTAENTQWDTAYTHSQIAGGDSVHVSTTENTQWDAAYTHSLDNSQAHSDYLINNGNDVTSGTLQINGTLDLATGSIRDSSGAITFGDENLSTSGTLASGTQTVTGNVTASGTIEAEHFSSLDDASIEDQLDVGGDVIVVGTVQAEHLTSTDDATIADTLTVAGVVDITNTTDSSDDSGDTGALRVEGGASIAKKLYVGTDLDVDGVSNLDAVDIDGNVQVDNQTTTVESSGAISITSEASVTINSKTDFYLNVDGRSSIRANTTSDIFFNTYSTTLNNNNYGLNNKATLYHFTTGGTDFQENYSLLAKFVQLAGTTEHETYPS
tara:strand:+ start:5698 stop:7182 length:1485 start_codon:yes stop_codon:yes gene_type:complete